MTPSTARQVPDPYDQPTMTVEEAGELMGLSRGSAYKAVRAGELPVIKVGKRLLIPTARLRAVLGIDDGPRAA